MVDNIRNNDRHAVQGSSWMAKFKLGDKFVVGNCIDLSHTGAQISFDDTLLLRKDQELEISFRPAKFASLDDVELMVDLNCQVVWADQGTRRVGIKFMNLSPRQQTQLTAVIGTNSAV